MRKKYFYIMLFIMIIAAAGFTVVFAESYQTIAAQDFDGNIKAYFNKPESVAACEINGAYTVIVGDRAVADSYARLVVYTDDGENKNISEFSQDIESDAILSKLEIYDNYLFAYNDFKKSIKIYDISDPQDTVYVSDFVIGADDFSIYQDTLYLLDNYQVDKYLLSDNEGIAWELAQSYVFTERPNQITAVNDTDFVVTVGSSGREDLYIADMEGTLEQIESEHSFFTFLKHHDGILYYRSDKVIYAYDIIQNQVIGILQIAASQIPFSQDIDNLSSIYVNESGVYITDRDLKKIVKYDHSLNYSGFCLSSFSNDKGRFNNPVSVSASGGVIAAADNERIQLLDGNIIAEYLLDFNPQYAFKTADEVIAINDNEIYTSANNFYVPYSKPWALDNILDAKFSADNILYMLTDDMLCARAATNEYYKMFDINGGLKFSISNKTRSVFVLVQDSILVFEDFDFAREIFLNDITEGENEYMSIETDFDGNIYLLSQDYNMQGAAIVKISGDTSEVFLLEDTFDDVNSMSIDYISGDVYFVSQTAHAVYKVQKNELEVAVAQDIPAINLPSNPQTIQSDYNGEVIIIGGYPSTMFYPFSADLQQEDFYPQDLAHEGEIIYLQSGTKLLRIYDEGEYSLVFYNGKLGFVLNDNITVLEYYSAEFSDGETLLKTAFYSLPYISEEADYLIDTIDKWERVNIISSLPYYEQNDFDWLYIEYNGDYGYINGANVMRYNPPAQPEYIEGSIIKGKGVVSLYIDTSAQLVLSELEEGSEIKIYYYSGDYAYISAESDGTEVFGYISKNNIAPDYTFQKQKLGFLLLFGTLSLAVIFAIIKRKYL